MLNSACVIWNSLQIAHSAGCGLICLESGVDRCR
jgi:hypothetical protein